MSAFYNIRPWKCLSFLKPQGFFTWMVFQCRAQKMLCFIHLLKTVFVLLQQIWCSVVKLGNIVIITAVSVNQPAHYTLLFYANLYNELLPAFIHYLKILIDIHDSILYWHSLDIIIHKLLNTAVAKKQSSAALPFWNWVFNCNCRVPGPSTGTN